jgi:hypothetical protein
MGASANPVDKRKSKILLRPMNDLPSFGISHLHAPAGCGKASRLLYMFQELRHTGTEDEILPVDAEPDLIAEVLPPCFTVISRHCTFLSVVFFSSLQWWES